MTHVELFAGIGGIGIAADRAGFDTRLFCEIDPHCQRVLAKHWPGVPIVPDVRDVSGDLIRATLADHAMGKQNPKYDNAVQMYGSGMSVETVAAHFGVTRQAMWKILARRGCQFRHRVVEGEGNPFYRGGRKAEDQAHNAVERALGEGRLVRPEGCDLCGCVPPRMADGRTSIQAHHDDYARPLEVSWLCQQCHFNKHNEIYLKEVTQRELRPTLLSAGFP